MRPFRFLGHVAPGVAGTRELTETSRRAEAIGYDVLVLPDHLIEQHAPIPLLTMVAAVTERVRVGTFVFNVDLRHPAVLAQDLASLDVLSGGRLEIGIGAGWNRAEYDAVGVRFDPAGTRVERLGEAIAVLKGCFGEGPFSFDGTHYTIAGHDGFPKPTQRPHPPIFVGGGGRKILTMAGQQADIIGLAPRLMRTAKDGTVPDPHSITAAGTEEKIAWIKAAAGDRFDQIELNAYPTAGPVIVTNQARPAAKERAEQLSKRTGVEVTADDVLESPHAFIGSIDGLTQKFIEMRERFGISSIMVGEIDPLAPVVERLAGT
ncbi:TIGR03621 family F420-dependent LLM class oxidoreductase [Phytoactinopolyspora alkaliphila]|uniref:TIGR03621 family F420-dependent LLM class oxidoreductase n=1 Tax=Phytoactinopolyspora alkaliphila TaxID=1783498 RepID=A0A6N9YNQ5_9ACTN|nr:TIGR03621 family F420-dependent LLM class oxidoreductase [Phytoactinopolyspora alkaliphila]NED96602.1 TIGR03621 family F420-dependent LLM class oxidoreductase [Phytoactinopolyspora alkaliphila]